MTDPLTHEMPLHIVIAKSELGHDVAYRVLQSTCGLTPGRKLGNKPPFRGPRYKHITTSVDRVIQTGEPQVERYSVSGANEIVEARPLRHPASGVPVAVSITLRTEDGASVRSPLDDLPLWIWDLPAEPGPPRLYLSETAINDFFRVAGTTTDRSSYGPLDYYSSFPALRAILAHLDWLYATYQGIDESMLPVWTQVGRLFEWDGRPSDRIGSIAEVRTSAQSVVGIGEVLTEWPQDADQHRDLDTILSGSVVAADGRHVALLDVRFPDAPYAVRWLSGPPQTFGNGFSTGQRSGIHPDDQARAAALIASGHPAGEAAWETMRIRSKTGAYEHVHFRGWFLDPTAAPTIAVVEVLDVTPEPC